MIFLIISNAVQNGKGKFGILGRVQEDHKIFLDRINRIYRIFCYHNTANDDFYEFIIEWDGVFFAILYILLILSKEICLFGHA